MADYQLRQSGPTIQDAIDAALAIGAQLQQEAAARSAADALLATKEELAAEAARAQAAETASATQQGLTAETNRASAAEDALSSRIDAINAKIPSAASSSNQLADKAFVNSSVSTATATFRGTSAPGLTQSQFLTWANGLTHDVNDYVYWNTTDAAGNTIYKRYKYDGSAWVFEYDLNNSSFTAAEWAAINSGITSQKVAQFTAKYDKPSSGIPKTDLASAVQTSLGKADTAVQPAAIADCVHLGEIIETL